jgi:ATP-dependent DNA ligase
MSLRLRTLPAGFIVPCLPTSAKRLPFGDGWLHEIKHDGFRCIARKDGKRVRLYSRPGNDLTRRFVRIVEAVARLKARTSIIDGEAVACGADGIALFDLIRYRQHDDRVFLRAFDIIELNGDDVRREALVRLKSYARNCACRHHLASNSTSTLSTTTARSCFNMPANLGSKASSRSAKIRAMCRAVRRTG